MPQKICLMYSTHEGKLKYRMTLNIPTYTKTAKIYQSIITNLFEIKSAEWQKDQEQNSGFEKKVFKLDISYIDLFVQSSLKKTLRKIDGKIEPTDIDELQLITANL